MMRRFVSSSTRKQRKKRSRRLAVDEADWEAAFREFVARDDDDDDDLEVVPFRPLPGLQRRRRCESISIRMCVHGQVRRIHGWKAKTNFPPAPPPLPPASAVEESDATTRTDDSGEPAAGNSRILLECCSDDLMDSLLAGFDIASAMDIWS
ncbi:hypothetical protein ABZP36_035552 [Zizania latifolia]